MYKKYHDLTRNHWNHLRAVKDFRRNSTDGASASTNQMAPSNLCFNTSCGTCCKTLTRVPARRVSSMLLCHIATGIKSAMVRANGFIAQGKRKSSEFSFARLKVVSLHSDMQENTSSSSMLAWMLDNIGMFHEFQIQSFSTFVAFGTNVSLMIQHHPSADCCLKPRFAPLGSGQHQMEKHLPRWIEYGQKYYMIFIDIFMYINILMYNIHFYII